MGEGSGLSVVSQEIEAIFPNLAGKGYEITSPATDDYNCIAWAAGATHQWWWPDPLDEEYWPPQVPRSATVEAFLLAYQTLGYEPCAEAGLEPGFEKIVLYAHADGTPTHAAKQLPSGQWTSKLGRMEDIIHNAPDSLAGEVYGQVIRILKRSLPRE
jgi:hypothetical protein